MARDGASAAAERRRVELRVLLARGGGEGSSPLPPVAEEEGEEEARRKGKQGLALLRLRGLGCASAAAAGAHAPVAAADAVRPSAEECNNGRRRRRKGKERRSARGGVAAGGGGVASGDVWCTCTPGIPFAAEASSVDCVVARQQTAGAGRRGEAERRHRERTADQRARRVTMREHISSSFMDSPPRFHMPFHEADLLHSGRHRHISGFGHSHVRTEEELRYTKIPICSCSEECVWMVGTKPFDGSFKFTDIMMFRTRLLLGRMGMYDQYQDWRLDVDNMNYEELLALEDRIGYVSTGLREDEIIRSLRMVKHSAFDHKHFPTEAEKSCSICQEEFEASEEMGRLGCGHSYHVHCIKQWLSRKNACPVCKIAVSKT